MCVCDGQRTSLSVPPQSLLKFFEMVTHRPDTDKCADLGGRGPPPPRHWGSKKALQELAFLSLLCSVLFETSSHSVVLAGPELPVYTTSGFFT